MSRSQIRREWRATRLVPLLAAALLAGCATTDGPKGLQDLLNAPMALVDSLGLAQGSAFREAVRGKDTDAALALYDKTPDALEKSAAPAVAELVALVNARWEPVLRAQRGALETAAAAGPAGIESTLARRGEAARALEDYRQVAVLKPAGRSLPAAAELQSAVAAVDQSLRDQAAAAFQAWPHGTKALFFDAVRIDLSPGQKREAIRAGAASLHAGLREADAAKAEELMKAYGPELDAADRAKLAGAFAERLGQLRYGSPRPAALSQRLALAQAAAQAGGPPVPTFVLKRPGAPAVQLDGKPLEPAIAPGEVQAEARRAAASGAPLVLLVDPGQAAVLEELSQPRQQTERRQAGTREVPNPAWSQAQAEVQRLERELRDIESQNQQLQNQAQDLARQSGGRGGGAFAALLGSYTGLSSVVTAKQQLQSAREVLAATPRQTSVPQYREESVPTWMRTSRTLARPALYAVMTDSMRVLKANREIDSASSQTEQGRLRDLPAAASAPASIDVPLEPLAAALDTARPVPLAEMPRLMAADDAAFQQLVRTRQQQVQRANAQAGEQIAQMQQGAAAASRSAASSAASPGPAAGRAGPAGGCHASLAYLGARIPRFRAPMLQQVRTAIVEQDVRTAIQGAKSQGFTADSAVEASNASARSMDEQAKVAGQCAAEFDAAGSTEEEFLAAIKDGRLDPASCDGMRNSCLCGAVAAKLGALASRSLAAAMQCHAMRGQW